jgi:hypothetical protein
MKLDGNLVSVRLTWRALVTRRWANNIIANVNEVVLIGAHLSDLTKKSITVSTKRETKT